MDSIRAKLKEWGARHAHVVLADLDGTLRQRRVSVAALEAAFAPEGTFCNVLHHWDIADSVFDSEPIVGEPIEPDPAAIRPYPFEPHAAWMFADYAGPSRVTSPRAVLAAQVERARTLGFDVRAAFEFEWLVYREDAHSIREKHFTALAPWAPDNRCWDGLSAAINADIVAELQGVLDQAEIPVLSLGMELGPGCVEATLTPRAPMRAADDAALFKLVAKAFFRRQGLSACFMAQPDLNAPGLSGHIHLSLWDGDRNLFRAGHPKPNSLAGCFSAGVLGLLPELLPMPLHTVNSYRRLSPGNWAPRTPTWSVQNYSTGIRAITGDHDSARLEFRIPGADVNPYLGLAMFLAAGLSGIERNEAAPPLVTGDGRAAPPAGTPELPHDLLSAATAMASSAAARDLFGEAFVERFTASRVHEFDTLRRAVSVAEKTRYFEAV